MGEIQLHGTRHRESVEESLSDSRVTGVAGIIRTGEDRRVGETYRSRSSTVDQSELIERRVGHEDIRGERYRESTGRELGFGWRWQDTVVVTANEGENDDRHQRLDGRLKFVHEHLSIHMSVKMNLLPAVIREKKSPNQNPESGTGSNDGPNDGPNNESTVAGPPASVTDSSH